MPALKLIVGLGNPGPQYSNTRHNVGTWLTEQLAQQRNLSFKTEAKFKAKLAVLSTDIKLAIPLVYMNCSGETVQAITKFYKIKPEEILIVHDELDFPPGIIRLKQGGGHGGHNGLRNIISHLHSNDFLRLRIGIGKPTNRDITVDYVLHTPSKTEQQQILAAIDEGLAIIPDLINGDIDKATDKLHSEKKI